MNVEAAPLCTVLKRSLLSKPTGAQRCQCPTFDTLWRLYAVQCHLARRWAVQLHLKGTRAVQHYLKPKQALQQDHEPSSSSSSASLSLSLSFVLYAQMHVRRTFSLPFTFFGPSRTRLLLNAGVSRSRTALTRTSVCCTMASVCRPAPSDNKVGCAAPPGSDVGCAAPSEAKAGCAALLVLPCCNRRARSRSVERKTRHVIYEPKAASHSSRTRPPCERGKIPLCFILPLLGSRIYYSWLALAL